MHAVGADLSVGSLHQLFPCAGLGVFTRTPVWKPLACTLSLHDRCACGLRCTEVLNAQSMLTQCSLAHSLALRLLLQKLSLAAPERKRGSGGPVLVMGGSDWGQLEGGLSAPHAHLGPRGPQGPLIHAGLPCESARLVMQGWTFAGDAARRKTEVERGGIRSLVFQPPGSNCQLAATVAEAQSW